MSTALPKWNAERESQLTDIVGQESPVTVATVATAAEQLETTTRSISSKLRKMDFDVESVTSTKTKSYSEAEEAEITDFLDANAGQYTYAEIALNVLSGSRTAKQIQGKILSMELTGSVKPTPKIERQKTYTDEEESRLTALVLAGGFIEDIAKEMGREVASIRGKVLSLSRTNEDIKIPKQREYKSKDVVDPITALGESIAEMTVEDIAAAIEKTVRGVKSMLTHRAIKCSNYDGASKAEKNAAKLAQAEA